MNIDYLPLSKYSIQELEEAYDHTIQHFKNLDGVDFDRMQLQVEYAWKVILAYHEGRDAVILIAPTGFGKSLMAFFVATFFMHLDQNSTSYILTSNKFLQKQYLDDIRRFKFYDFAMMQGQSNYMCHVSKRPFTDDRPCADESISALSSGKTDFKCTLECAFLNARQKAIDADTTILNYAYWLTTMNFVAAYNPNAAFKPRALTIFDECHVMGNIVQDLFTTVFNPTTFIRRSFNAFYTIRTRIGVDILKMKDFVEYERLVYIYEQLVLNQENTELTMVNLKQLIEELLLLKNQYVEHVKTLISKLPVDNNGDPIKSSEEKQMINFVAYLVDITSGIAEMVSVFELFGHITLVASTEPLNSKIAPIEKFNNRINTTLKIQCTNESSLCQRAVHRFTGHSLFMSATIGNAHDWAEQTGLENYEAIEVPQVFNYDKSPIYKLTPMVSMSYKNKYDNMPKLMNRIRQLIDHHQGQNGIIHTGNFEIMNQIERLNHPRVLTYKSSKEKEHIVARLSATTDYVIAGPSLVEGVDLKDDLCRFMIFAKLPTLSLADKLNRRKIELYKNWYDWNIMQSFLQGLGRAIRNNQDWCTTYILDSSFNYFLHRYPAPFWVRERFSEMRYDNLGQKVDTASDLEDFLDSI